MKLLLTGFLLTIHALLAFSRYRATAIQHGFQVVQSPLDIKIQAWIGVALALYSVLFSGSYLKPIQEIDQQRQAPWSNCFIKYNLSRGSVLTPFLNQKLGTLSLKDD